MRALAAVMTGRLLLAVGVVVMWELCLLVALFQGRDFVALCFGFVLVMNIPSVLVILGSARLTLQRANAAKAQPVETTEKSANT